MPNPIPRGLHSAARKFFPFRKKSFKTLPLTRTVHPPPKNFSAETYHEFRESGIELFCWWDWDRKLKELEGVIVLEVDFREVTSPKATKKPQRMTIPLPGGHGHGV